MTLSSDDKEWVKLITAKIVGDVQKEIIKEHTLSCPYGKMLSNSKWFIAGLIAGPAVVGGGVGFGLAKLFTGI